MYLWHSAHRSPFDFFWGPLVKSSEPVLFCVADQGHYSTITLRDAANPSRQMQLQDNLTAIIIDDLNPIVRVAGLLQSSGKKYTLKGEGTTNLMDLRNGPTVFIGAFDNAWTLRLTAPLRYHFVVNREMTDFGIVDSTNPEQPGLGGQPNATDDHEQLSRFRHRFAVSPTALPGSWQSWSPA